MLTARVEGIHGDISVFEVARVIKGSDAKKTNKDGTQIEFFDAKHAVIEVAHFGNVFVMNDAGKTIASYFLGGCEHADKKK